MEEECTKKLIVTGVGHPCADEVTGRRVENSVELDKQVPDRRVGQPSASEPCSRYMLGNHVPRNPGTACTERQHTRVRTRQHSVVDTVTSWFINEKQQQATKKNNELKAKQHSDPAN